MPVLSVTHLRLHRGINLVRFFIENEAAVRQIVRAAGFIKGKLLAEPNLAMWGTTLWHSEDAVYAYFVSGAHRELMRKVSAFACESQAMHMPYATDKLPAWTLAHELLQANGRFSTALEKPSSDHLNGVIPPPRFTLFTRPLSAKQEQG